MASLMRGLGSENIDLRARIADAALATGLKGAPWLGMPIDSVNALQRIVLVGSFLRKDHPLLAARVRAAVKRGARVAVLNAATDDLLMPTASRWSLAPSQWAHGLAAARVALLRARGEAIPQDLAGIEPDAAATALAAVLADGERKAVFLGNSVGHHPQASAVAAQAQALADASGATLGWLVEGANGTGGYLAGAIPGAGGLDARAMVEQPRKAYLLLGIEPRLDHGHPAAALSALKSADTVIALSAYVSDDLLETADCLLPIAPFTETSGSFVNAAGTVQSFNGVVRPAGDARPAWKVLRVLGNLLNFDGFDQDSSEQVRDAVLTGGVSGRLSVRFAATPGAVSAQKPVEGSSLERIADVPIYFADPIVRRATSLQDTTDAQAPRARLNSATAARLGLGVGQSIRLSQAAAGAATLPVLIDEQVADGVVRLAAGHVASADLNAMIGPIQGEPV